MKLYKFQTDSKYIYTIAENTIEAKKWIDFRYKGAKFITIVKDMLWK